METQDLKAYSNYISWLVRGGDADGLAAATATLESTGGIRSATVKAAGSGYSVNDVLTVATGTGGTFTVTEVSPTGAVLAVALKTKGTGYGNVDGAVTTVSPNVGTNCTLKTVCEFAVDSIAVDEVGADYTTAYPKFSGGGNEGWALGTATVAAGEVTAVTAPADIKYTSVPTITIEAGGPEDAAAFVVALQEFDTSLQNTRIKSILEDIIKTEVLTPISAPIINEIISSEISDLDQT